MKELMKKRTTAVIIVVSGIFFMLIFYLPTHSLVWNNISRLTNCNIEDTKKLPERFSVIIGHAYGQQDRQDDEGFIAPKVYEFLLKKQKSINAVVFTGDVFNIPTSAKFNRLYSEFSRIKIFIAPGNHDVSRADSREVFNISNAFFKEFPYLIKVEEFAIIVEDSIKTGWNVDSRVAELLALEHEHIIVARHNVPIKELITLANSSAGSENLYDLEEFKSKVGILKQLTWVVGDGGNSEHHPRISCKEFENHRFIINGIGEHPGDTILILTGGKYFQYQL